MVKKVLVGGFLALTLLSSVSFAYTDTEGHWADNDITNLSLNGIITGYSDNSFRPNNNMTRAELVTVINRMLGNSVQNSKYVPDINVKDWYYPEIRKGIQSGIVKGDSEGYVRPNDFVTREEAVVMLYRALMATETVDLVEHFTDFDDVSEWSKSAFMYFMKFNYIKGYDDGTLRPKNYITRAEVVKLIQNIVNIYATYGSFTGEVHGNMLVLGKNVTLKNITIDGNLIIAEGAKDTVNFENIIIEGNLITRVDLELPAKNFKLIGKVINITQIENEDTSKYINDDYGISFSIPDKAKVVYIDNDNMKINYNSKNLMTIRINQNDDLYFMGFDTALFKERKRFDVPYTEMYRTKVGIYNCVVYGSPRDDSYFVYLKRDNVEYSIYFYNIDNINVIDSLVNSIKLYNGVKITPHAMKVYKNPKLYLKFSYLDYVTIDDSYNTGIVNEDESFYKMFIQVTNIVDMSNYTLDELKEILVSLEDPEDEIISAEVKKVYTYDAIEYTVKSNEKLTKSLYIVISTKLYHFIFTGEEYKMEPVGLEVYENIIDSIEF